MSTLTKQWLQQKIAEMEAARDEIPFGLDEGDSNTLAALRIALASLEAEAVCVIDQSNLDYLKSGSDADVWPASRAEMGDVLLYRSATPAPVSVPDEVCWEDVPEEITEDDMALASAWAHGFNQCRAAMLQGARNHPEDNLDMVDHSGDSNNMVEPVTTACKLRDAVDTIRNSGIAIDGEKILAERDALNSPVIPDGWVAVPVEPTIAILDEFDSIIDYGAEDSKDAWSRLLAAAWIKSLPAAPQLEVK